MINNNTIIVGMADLKSAKKPAILTTLGLGSCVGIALYEPVSKVIGMAHCMLPDSKQISNNSNVAKFVDTGVLTLIREMSRMGARKELIRAKLAGGAQMFAFSAKNEIMRIGDRNVEAARKVLGQLSIPIVSSETGDCFGRTIELHSDDNRLVIKTIGHGTRII